MNQWIASFEANDEDSPAAAIVKMFWQNNRLMRGTRQLTLVYKVLILWSKFTMTLRSDQSSLRESPRGLTRILVRGRFSRYASQSGDTTPFIERRKVFSTSIAGWPKLDDDQSAMTLSSLHQDVGNDVRRPNLSEPSPHVTKAGVNH